MRWQAHQRSLDAWPYPVHLSPGNDATVNLYVAVSFNHCKWFRGFAQLPDDVNALIMEHLRIYVKYALCADTTVISSPTRPHTWSLLCFHHKGAGYDRLKDAVRAGIEMENELIWNNWSPCLSLFFVSNCIRALYRIQENLAYASHFAA